VLGELGRFEEALASFERAIAINPENVSAWYYKGMALAITNRPEEAIDAVKQALRLAPDFEEARVLLDQLQAIAANQQPLSQQF
jgi:tetratricopeptide (TPR) repeat protein